MDWKEEIKQVIRRIAEDEIFRQAFFSDPEAALAEYALSKRAYRYLTTRVDEATFAEEYGKFFPQESLIVRGDDTPRDLGDLDEAALPIDRGGDDALPKRIVSTGFSTDVQPDDPLDSHTPLTPATDYYYWFEVGERVAGSVEVTDVELPVEKLPPEARLHVVLFAFEGEMAIFPGADVGQIKIGRNGRVRVTKPAAVPDSLAGSTLLTRRLFFPVRTPAQAGDHRLRCNIYYQQTLVQSRLVTVRVEPNPVPQDEAALKAEVDYTLSRTLDGSQLHGMGQNRLSLMLNDNGNGTHGFRFFGESEFKNDAALGAGELGDLINKARGALRKAAWGDEEPYLEGKTYRYGGRINLSRLTDDLVRLAIRGYRFYDAIINQLAGDADQARALADLMLKPGQVQIASKQSARLVVPAALFYDYPLDDGRSSSDYSLCATFIQSLKTSAPLPDTACFQGNCPRHDDDTVICPSGFWGYRHSLGLPVSVNQAPDAPPEIPSPNRPIVDISVFTGFESLPQHLQQLQAMGIVGERADSRDETLEMLKETHAQMVYFYCHGGITNENIPFLQVGTDHDPRLTPSNLRSKRIRWQEPRPLVFINGCHTTALSPEAAIDLVSGFVENARAAGVVGTEITIFEPMAVMFAEACFDRFLLKRQTLGEAIRGARLAMLQAGNPLGLVYIPFAMAGLKVVEQS